MRIELHFNRAREAQGLEPWFLLCELGTLYAYGVTVRGTLRTQCEPHRTRVPRYYLVCEGEITWEKPGHAVVVTEEAGP